MELIDKKALSERDICTKYITLAIVNKAGWDLHTQIREEVYFTKGRVSNSHYENCCFQGDSLESQAIAKIAIAVSKAISATPKIANVVSEIANAMPAKGYAIVISIPLTQSRVLLVDVAIALSTITPSCI